VGAAACRPGAAASAGGRAACVLRVLCSACPGSARPARRAASDKKELIALILVLDFLPHPSKIASKSRRGLRRGVRGSLLIPLSQALFPGAAWPLRARGDAVVACGAAATEWSGAPKAPPPRSCSESITPRASSTCIGIPGSVLETSVRRDRRERLSAALDRGAALRARACMSRNPVADSIQSPSPKRCWRARCCQSAAPTTSPAHAAPRSGALDERRRAPARDQKVIEVCAPFPCILFLFVCCPQNR